MKIRDLLHGIAIGIFCHRDSDHLDESAASEMDDFNLTAGTCHYWLEATNAAGSSFPLSANMH